MKKILFLLMLAGFFAANGQQNNKCGHDYTVQTLENTLGDYAKVRELFFEEVAKTPVSEPGAEATVYTIPVVFHIIYDDPEDNISRAQVLDGLEKLNLDYRRQNADAANTRSIFQGVAADIEIEFELARLDPQGNCTEGITRTYSTLTNGANNNVKPLINWDNKRYLNIWVVASINVSGGPSNVLGYAYQPVAGGNPYTLDGVVIRHDQIGTIGTAVDPTLGDANLGRTLTHEVGHYLGLDHTFLGGCFGFGDGCADTPPALEANYGCPTGINSCSNDVPNLPDQIENYMDYSDGPCQNMFTVNQRSIMRSSVISTNLRNQLVTNLQQVGLAANQALPCLPKPGFKADERIICAGGSVSFTDLTYMGDVTNYQWTFVGGNPSNSSQQNPIVTYSNPGSYTVSLTTTNAVGTVSHIETAYIGVRSSNNFPGFNGFGDDFEAFPLPNNNWLVAPGLDTMNFRYYYTTAFNNSQSCVTLQNFDALKGEIDQMISLDFSLKDATAAQLTFNYAFVERFFGNTDKLRVYASNDCGATWNLINTQAGPTLRTIGTKIDVPWHPQNNSEWQQATIDLSAYAGSATNVMLMFEFENGGGNNLYIDDLAVSATISVAEELLESEAEITLFPNPAKNFVQINVPNGDEDMELSISNIAGQEMYKFEGAMPNTVQISTQVWPRGLYLVTLKNGSKTISKKLMVN